MGVIFLLHNMTSLHEQSQIVGVSHSEVEGKTVSEPVVLYSISARSVYGSELPYQNN